MPVFTNVAAQQRIDSEIAEIAGDYAAILKLRRERNTFAAIYHLPDDVLSFIFVLCTEWFDALSVPLVWRTILAVCIRWRELALATPRFSSTLVLSDTRNLISMLKYSAHSPIRVYYPLSQFHERYGDRFDRADNVFMAVLQDPQNLGRLKQLVVTSGRWSTNGFKNVFRALEEHGAPFLQEMALVYEHPGREYTHHQLNTFPWTSLSSLRQLELQNILLPLDKLPLPHLTHLTLTFTSFPRNQGIPVSFAVSFLRKVPNVEVVNIKIVEVFPRWYSELVVPDLGVPFALSTMRSFTVTSDPITGCRLLKHFNFAHSTHINLSLTHKMSHSTVGLVTVTDQLLLAGASLVDLLSSLVTAAHDPEITVSFAFQESTLSLRVTNSTPTGGFDICVANQHDIMDLLDYIEILESSGVTSLAVRLTIANEQAWNADGEEVVMDGGFPRICTSSQRRCYVEAMRRDLWSQILPIFGSIESLCISKTALPFLTTILRPLSVVNQCQETGHAVVSASLGDLNPSLRHVTLTLVKWNSPFVSRLEALHYAATLPFANEGGREGDAEQDLVKATIEDEEDIGGDLMDLATLLQTRQAAGLLTIQFTLEQCRITPRQIQFLREHAQVKVQNPIPWAGFTNISSV
ncbi:hypothetical protein ONZ45_g12948 [Pleurotus djamor]|nr:hypothetical protein ONZ45_g12948 [Pleurotus djamor]